MKQLDFKIIYSLIFLLFLIGCNQPLYVDTAAYTEDYKELNSACKSYTASGFHDGNGTPSNPYIICKAQHLDILRDKLIDDYANYYNKHYIVREDIDYNGSLENPFFAIGDIYDYELVDYKSAPNAKPFQGTFDGNGKKISGLYTEGPNFAYHGLFQYLGDQAVVKDLTINFYFNLEDENYFIGGIAGYSEGKIENVNVFGIITGDEIFAGGLVAGYHKNNDFNNSVVAGHVQSSLGTELGGLFGSVANATIDNVTIPASITFLASTLNCKVDGSKAVGGIVGKAEDNVTISNLTNKFEVKCSDELCGGIVGVGLGNVYVENAINQSRVSSTSQIVGGIAGRIETGEITNVTVAGGGTFATNIVQGTDKTGGVIGDANAIIITNATVTTRTVCTNSFCGGAAGVAIDSEFNDITIAGTVLGSTDFVGGIVGTVSSSDFDNIDVYSNVQGQNYIGGIIGQSNGDISLTDIVFDASVLASNDYAGALIGKALDYLVIDNVDLDYNINVNGVQYIGLAIGYYENTNSSSSSLKGFNISGSLNGNNLIGGVVGYGKGQLFVDNITLTVNIDNDVNTVTNIGGIYTGGAFGKYEVTSGVGRFQDITINSGSLVNGEKNNVGGLCGYCEGNIIIDSVISNASVVGVTGKVGGLVGHMIGGSIVNSQVNALSGISSGTGSGASHVGGLVGYLEFGNILKSSVLFGTIVGYGNIGGLVGHSISSTINQSYATPAIFANGANSGGLIGRMFAGYLANSYATGAVNLGAGTFKGGLIGRLSNSATIVNSYSRGIVSNPSGGAVATSDSSSTISGLLWNTTTSTAASSAEGTGYTTTQMQTTNPYAGYDFSTIWNLPSTGVYPTLQ